MSKCESLEMISGNHILKHELHSGDRAKTLGKKINNGHQSRPSTCHTAIWIWMERKPSGGKKWSKKALKNVALLFSLGFRASGTTCIWFWTQSWHHILCFSFLSLFDEKMWKSKEWWKKVWQEKKKSHTCCKGAHGIVLWKNLRLFALWWHFGSRSLARSVVERLHVNFSAHPCRLQPMVLWPVRQPNDGRNESIPCVHVWSGLCIACPYLCWHCFDGSMRYLATRDHQRHGFLMRLFCQLLSDVWHHAASVFETK